MIYLDNNATTRVADEVLEAMRPYSTEWYGNPHSPHSLGRAAHEGVETARAQVAALLHARAEEIVFTSCGTESNAIVIRSIARKPRARFVATRVEHPSVLALLEELAREGHELALVGVDSEGRIDLDAMARELARPADLVCLMLAQNETGVLHDVASVASLAGKAGAKLLVDAVQAAGKVPLDAASRGADYLSISGHKLHGPKGAGALWMRKGSEPAPLWRGGGQEHGLRSGTEGVPGLVGLGKAAELAQAHLESAPSIAALRDRLADGMRAAGEVRVHGTGAPRLPNTASIGFRGFEAADLLARFDEAGICVSAGAACHSGSRTVSGVLGAMNVPVEYALGTIRFSLSRYTTANEIDRTIAAAQAILRHSE